MKKQYLSQIHHIRPFWWRYDTSPHFIYLVRARFWMPLLSCSACNDAVRTVLLWSCFVPSSIQFCGNPMLFYTTRTSGYRKVVQAQTWDVRTPKFLTPSFPTWPIFLISSFAFAPPPFVLFRLALPVGLVDVEAVVAKLRDLPFYTLACSLVFDAASPDCAAAVRRLPARTVSGHDATYKSSSSGSSSGKTCMTVCIYISVSRRKGF